MWRMVGFRIGRDLVGSCLHLFLRYCTDTFLERLRKITENGKSIKLGFEPGIS
jgi:hypothetical protein